MAATRRIADRYALDERLGTGGAGVVWSAHDDVLERRVAIKQVDIPDEVPPDERDRVSARVIREARAAARLNHRGATTVYDVFESDGSTYIVMELVDGPTLKGLVGRDGPLPPSRAAEIGLALLDTLASAHDIGIIHRDVKPANVMLPDGGPPKLTDFGIASIVDDPSLTTSGLVLGSPAFMSPEQAQGGEVGPATDLWSLGATLYFAVEGVLPFDRERSMATLNAIVRERPRPMRRAGALEPVITRLLAKDPAERPDVAETRRLLERAAAAGDATTADEATQVMPPVAPTEPQERVAEPPAPTRPQPRDDRTPPPHRDDRYDDGYRDRNGERSDDDRDVSGLPRALAILGILLFVAVLAVLLWPRGDGEDRFADDGEDTATEDVTTPADGTTEEGGAVGDATGQEAPTTPPAETTPPTEGDEGDAAATPPEGWTTYDPEAPYSVAHPEGWTVQPSGGTTTDITDPSTGSYLRIDWTDEPADDPYADWQAYESEFAESHADYERIRLERTDFRGRDAAIWEYRYREGGALLHAYNLNIGGEQYAYALNWQTREGDWEAMLDLWEVFTDTFQPEGP